MVLSVTAVAHLRHLLSSIMAVILLVPDSVRGQFETGATHGRLLTTLHTGVWLKDELNRQQYLLYNTTTESWAPIPSVHDGTNVTVLLVGDSLDRNIVASACKCDINHCSDFTVRNPTLCKSPSSPDLHSHICSLQEGRIIVANIFFTGLDEFRPNKETCEIGFPPGGHKQINYSAKALQGRIPQGVDLVLYKGMYWDVKNLCTTWTASLANQTSLFEILLSHRKAVATMVNMLRALYPSAMIGIHTDPHWLPSDRFGSGCDEDGLGNGILQNLRSVAASQNLPLFDFLHIFERLKPQDYLQDDIHPSSWFSLIELDLTLYFVSAYKRLGL